MAIIKLQGEKEKREGYYYEFDTTSTPLGEGGMGKVYRGRRININTGEVRDVAIKFMFAGLPESVIQRAENEANIRIKHDNLVEMMGFLKIETPMQNGTVSYHYHVVSELLQGVALSDLLQGNVTDQNGNTIAYAEQLYKLHQTNPVQFAVLVTKKVLSGIMALHDAGYIHRDIDPSNIMVTRDEKIKLIDFGIAKKVDGLKTLDRNLTTAGQFLGKPQYAAPELIVGDIAHQNRPTDIYAMGIMLFQLLTGHLPFEGPSNVVLKMHLNSKMPLGEVKNKVLRGIIERATAKDCTRRYQSAAEFRAALDYVGLQNPSSPSLKDKLPLIGGIAAGVVVVAGIIGGIAAFSGGKGDSDSVGKNHDTKVVHPEDSEARTVEDICADLLKKDKAAGALAELQALAGKNDPEALFTLSQLYAVSYGSFNIDDDFVRMQANLQDQLKQSGAKCNELLRRTVKAKPDFYPALYWLGLHNYEPNLKGGGAMQLSEAEYLFREALKAAKAAGDPVYEKKIQGMLDKF